MTTSALHDRIERRTGLLFGTYRSTHPRFSRWPLFAGPVGDWPAGSTYWQAWRRASGAEVSVFGRTVYVARMSDDG